MDDHSQDVNDYFPNTINGYVNVYPFRYKHLNHFPPQPRHHLDSPPITSPMSNFQITPISTPKYPFPSAWNMNQNTIPPRIRTDIPISPRSEYTLPTQLLPQTPTTPLQNHPSTSHKLAELLQEVAGIMDTITGEKMMCGEELDGEEGEVLYALTEMVLIMEEEVEGMIELADVIEEYVEEMEMAELEGWVKGLTPTLENSAEGIEYAEEEWEGATEVLGDGKESIRIALDEGSRGVISVGGLLEKVEEDVLGWRLRSFDQGSYEPEDLDGEEPEIIVPAQGNAVPLRMRDRDADFVKENIISLPMRNEDREAKFRDSALDLVSPVGSRKRREKKRTVRKDSVMRYGRPIFNDRNRQERPQWV